MPQIAQQDYLQIFCPLGIDVPQDEQKAKLADSFDAGTILDVVLVDEASKARIVTATKDDGTYTFEYFYSGESVIVEYERP